VKTLTIDAGPCLYVLLPLEGQPIVSSNVAPEEVAAMVAWALSRAAADENYAALMAAALPFANWPSLQDGGEETDELQDELPD
jgi:hypothetical protein